MLLTPHNQIALIKTQQTPVVGTWAFPVLSTKLLLVLMFDLS